MNLRVLLVVLALSPTVSLAADVEATLQSYLAQLALVEKARVPTRLEPLFDAAGALQDALMEIHGELAQVERLSDAQFAALRTRARGLELSRGQDVYAQPDPAFLLDLAQRHGQASDQAFFAAYRSYWNEERLPAYLAFGDRPRPCVQFGDDLVLETYARWREFATRHPAAYVAFARQAIADAEETLEMGTCACGAAADVTREQRRFLERFRDARAPDRIRARLQQIEAAPDDLPVHCR